ncbi:pilus assembly protein [Acidihalobacter ferrooxydans]|uniref:pilus assembly protein n=1 Tax=Acidihalobacter ferrooxydans TaxID=1765967 RepID=UPI001E57ADD5|nr:PilC/PilY family type IV pilus protein [Acidihalobacter ferrooxydans]
MGAYLGLGIDEWGGFSDPGRVTDTGPGQTYPAFVLRGAGSVSNANNSVNPWMNGLSNTQIGDICKTGTFTASDGTTYTPFDYPYIAGRQISLGQRKMANQQNTNNNSPYVPPQLSKATPLGVKITINPQNILNAWYSYNGGAYQPIVTNYDLVNNNAGPALPDNVLFGFASATAGGSGGNNYHDLSCFRAAPLSQSRGSVGANTLKAGEEQTKNYLYVARYNTIHWSGNVLAYPLNYDASTQMLVPATNAKWSASCDLTGGDCPTTGQSGVTAQSPSNRVMITSNGGGVPFAWADLSSGQQQALEANWSRLTPAQQSADFGGNQATFGQDVLDYLRGDRSLEVSANGSRGVFRPRTSVLGDIITSSPTFVGVPSHNYPAAGHWKNLLYPAQSEPENAPGAQSYSQFVANVGSRPDVVYVGANDGFIHGFAAGQFVMQNGQWVYQDSTASGDTGKELLAFLPSIGQFNSNNNANPSVLQDAADYASVFYGHQYMVNATPGHGDVFYGGKWHTWLVGGLGAGGRGLYALDITHPSQFSEANAAHIVIGQWNNPRVSGTHADGAGWNYYINQGMGFIHGTPVITNFNNGEWGFVSGNGTLGSTGIEGIIIGLINPSTGAVTLRYLETGCSATGGNCQHIAGVPAGIQYVTPVDMNGDHTADYIYAGDNYGNVWRFNVTSNNPNNWRVSYYGTGQATPLFEAGQPITTEIMAVRVLAGGQPRLMLDFGTGRRVGFTHWSHTVYATGTQRLYGIMDWNVGAWNTFKAAPSPNSNGIVSLSQLQQQTVNGTFIQDGTKYRTVSNNAVCWPGSTGCGSGPQYGWYLNLPGRGYNYPEQVTYNPTFINGLFTVNTTVPGWDNPVSCNIKEPGSWTMALNPATGGLPPSGFFINNTGTVVTNGGVPAAGAAVGAVGTLRQINYAGNQYAAFATAPGGVGVIRTVVGGGANLKRINWVEIR